MTNDPELIAELAELLVKTLNLDVKASEIATDAPLFGDQGLGLDSIDALELAFAIAKRYDIQIKSSDDENQKIFASLDSIATYITTHKPT